MVTSDMQCAADLPSRCCLFNNLCSVYDLLHAKIYYSTSVNANKYFFLLLVIVMDSIKSNVSVYFVEGIQ